MQGDVLSILDSYGATVVSYVYDSWGKLISTTGTMASTLGVKNPIRYRGYYYDTETNLYYFNSRYYDPEVGRWINPDLNASNAYAFSGNDPVNVGVISGQMQAVKTSAVAASSLSKIAGIYSGGVSGNVIAATGSTSACSNLFQIRLV